MGQSQPKYREVLGSDVPNDGMYIELRNSSEQVVACVFRSDVTGAFEVHVGPATAPVSVTTEFIARAKLNLSERAAT